MVRYTVLVPARDAADAVARLLPRLDEVLASLLLPYEILCVDDGSQPSAWRTLEDCRRRHAGLRVLRFDRPRGTSAALTAAVAASRGELVIGLSAEPRFDLHYIPHMISRLSKYDLVVGEPERSLGEHARYCLARVPRLFAGESRQPTGEGLFFAARREAVSGLGLTGGAAGVLPALVARRGFRVCRMTIGAGLPPRGDRYRVGVVERAAARWFDRHFEPHRASEPTPGPAVPRPPMPARPDLVAPRYVPPTAALPAKHQPDHSA